MLHKSLSAYKGYGLYGVINSNWLWRRPACTSTYNYGLFWLLTPQHNCTYISYEVEINDYMYSILLIPFIRWLLVRNSVSWITSLKIHTLTIKIHRMYQHWRHWWGRWLYWKRRDAIMSIWCFCELKYRNSVHKCALAAEHNSVAPFY